jgi:hypothetical protein
MTTLDTLGAHVSIRSKATIAWMVPPFEWRFHVVLRPPLNRFTPGIDALPLLISTDVVITPIGRRVLIT